MYYKITYLLLLLSNSFIASSQEGNATFSIEGELTTLKKNGVVYLAWQEPWEFHEFFKADIINGKFKFNGKFSQPTKGSLRVVTLNDSLKPEQKFPWECDVVEFFMCEGKTKIIGRDSLSTAKIISNCAEGKLLEQFNAGILNYEKRYDSALSSLRQAYEKRDTANIKLITNVVAISKNDIARYYETSILQNLSSYLGVNLLNDYVYNQLTDTLKGRMASTLYQFLRPKQKNSPIAEAVGERIFQFTHRLKGTPFKDFTLKDTSGRSISLKQFNHKIILLDFWASWCSPCRQEFPELIKLYEKYKYEDFEIVSISIDDSKQKWMEAIRKDKTPWTHLLDEGRSYGGKASRLYYVRSLPTKVLIDRNGKIVADRVDIREVPQVEKILKSLVRKE